MNCPACSKETAADRMFCHWCDVYMPDTSAGERASLGRRLVAAVIDPFAVAAAIVLPPLIVGAVLGKTLGSLVAFGALLTVIITMLVLFSRGQTLGKYLMGERVVERRHGTPPGFLRMLFRETIGKFVSGLFFGLGWFWAIWDKDHQAWHDKIASTVVVRRASAAVRSPITANLDPAREARTV